MFYGMEWSLITFELMLFVTVDILSSDFILAAFITYVVACVSFLFDFNRLLMPRFSL